MRDHYGMAARTQTFVRRADRRPAMMRALHDLHADPLWRYAFRRTGDRTRAEYVVQETILRARRHLNITDGEQPVRTWLFTVRRNIVIDESRTARFRNEFSSADPRMCPTGQGRTK